MLADLAVAERPGREPLDGGARILRREQWGPADEPWRKRPLPGKRARRNAGARRTKAT